MGAVLLGALLPTLSHASARWASPSGWVEICTSTGMVWVHTQSGEQAETVPDGSPVSGMAGCTWCLLHGGAGGVPAAASVAHPDAVDSAALPLPSLTGPLAPPIWPSALTRAPPQLT